MRMRIWLSLWLFTTLTAISWPHLALADGAFPDSSQILLAADKPNEIIVGTNFGILITEDDGHSWRWICEEAFATYATIFTLTAAPDDTLLIAAPAGLLASHDGGCTFTTPSGNNLSDIFADPKDAHHAFAISTLGNDAGIAYSGLYQASTDPTTVGTLIYSSRPSAFLTGAEIAQTAPPSRARPIYLTMSDANFDPLHPFVLRSDDGGQNFAAFDHANSLSGGGLRLAAVDPTDPLKLYLRLLGQAGDSLVISEDGGEHVRVALPLAHSMSSFLRQADGTLLVGTRESPSYLSSDGGQHFSEWSSAPHLRALAERDGVLYVAADNFADGFAIAKSSDRGAHFTSLLRFDQLLGPLQCGQVPQICAAPWERLSSQLGIGGAVDAGVDSGQPIDLTPSASGGCTVGGKSSNRWFELAGLAIFLSLGLLMRWRRRS